MKIKFSLLLFAIFFVGACEDEPPNNPTTFSSSLFVKTAQVAAGAECPNGGISIDSGLDTNNNKALDASEVVETQIVCHGLNGSDGANGTNGTNGLNSLVSVSDEPVGANCGAGGKKIEIGLDSNTNNTLDAAEITSTQYVCHGLSGSGGAGANTNCTIVTGADNSTVLQCSDQSVVLVPGNVTVLPTTVTTIPGGFEIGDAWQSSAGRNSSSFRNSHYLVDITQDGDINLDIIANSPHFIYLLDSAGILIKQASNTAMTATLTAGTYTVVAATVSPNVSENYNMTLTGNVNNIRRVAADYLIKQDSWVNSGGRNEETFRNSHYTFTAERDTYLDVILQSSVPTSLYLINSQGFLVASYGSGGLVGAISTDLPADSYTLVAATHSPGVAANYTLELYGHFANFTKTASDMLSFQDTWANSGGRNPNSFRNHHYTVAIANPTYLDVILQSSVAVSMYLIDAQGITVGSYGSGGLTGLVSRALEPGNYTLVAATHSPGAAVDYTLEFFGHFSSITKILPSPITKTTGAWENSAGRVVGSYRNDHFSFKTEADTYMDIILSSSVPVAMYLVDSLGITQASYGSAGLTGVISLPVPADTYTLVVATHSPGQAANYTLELHGQYSGFAPIVSQTLQQGGAWISSGGASATSADNPRFKVTVTKDSYVDIMVDSAVPEILYLLNNLGAVVKQVNGGVLAGDVPAGEYTIVVGTTVAGQTGPFNLSVIGQVSGLLPQ